MTLPASLPAVEAPRGRFAEFTGMGESLVITAPPAEPAVTVAELKTHIRLSGDNGAHDVLLANLIGAATQLFERQTGRAVVTRTCQFQLDQFLPMIHLPAPPAQELVKVEYLDADGLLQELSAGVYHADLNHVPARLTPAPGQAWPATLPRIGAVIITFTAGVAAASVPQDIKAAILMIAAHLYEHPEATSVLSLDAVPLAVGTIIDAHRIPWL